MKLAKKDASAAPATKKPAAAKVYSGSYSAESQKLTSVIYRRQQQLRPRPPLPPSPRQPPRPPPQRRLLPRRLSPAPRRPRPPQRRPPPSPKPTQAQNARPKHQQLYVPTSPISSLKPMLTSITQAPAIVEEKKVLGTTKSGRVTKGPAKPTNPAKKTAAATKKAPKAKSTPKKTAATPKKDTPAAT